MTSDRNRTRRRAFLGSIAAGTLAMAGCTDLINRGSDGSGENPTSTSTSSATGSPTGTDSQNTTTGGNGGNDAPGSYKPMKPAAAGFENVSYWTAHAGVNLSADKKTVFKGSAAARVANRSGTIEREFQVPKNLNGKDVSLAFKLGKPAATNMYVGLTDTGNNTTELIETYYKPKFPNDWVRLGPSVNSVAANMQSIKSITVTIDGPGNNKKYWVDELRFHDRPVDKGQVMFTFDYATKSIYDIAFPIMKKRGLKGCVAVPVDRVGNEGRLTREQLTEMKDAGWEIASMSNNFAEMHGQDRNIQKKRLQRANRLLKDWGLGEPSTLIYPKGACDATTLELARQMHDVALTKFEASRNGHNQVSLPNPVFVNRARPNSPDALRTQLRLARKYGSVFTLWHNKLGSNAQNSRAEFRQMCDIVKQQQQKGNIDVTLPSELASK